MFITKPKLKAISHFFAAIICSFATYSTSFADDNQQQPTSNIKVAVSIKPLYNLVLAVTGDVIAPKLLVKGYNSPHDYSLKPSEAKLIHSADIIFWGGPQTEPFLNKIMHNISEKKSIAFSKFPEIKKLPMRSSPNWEHSACCHGHEHTHTHEHGHKHSHKHTHEHHHDNHAHHHHNGSFDAHFWLSPENAAIMIDIIAQELSKVDPQNAEQFKSNAATFKEKLKAADENIKQQLLKVKDIPFIVFHDAFQYFEKHYKLNGVGAITINPETPPSAQRVKEIQNILSQNKVKHLFREPQFQPKIVDSIKSSLKVSIEIGKLDPLGEDEDTGPEGYIKLIENLAKEFSNTLENYIYESSSRPKNNTMPK